MSYALTYRIGRMKQDMRSTINSTSASLRAIINWKYLVTLEMQVWFVSKTQCIMCLFFVYFLQPSCTFLHVYEPVSVKHGFNDIKKKYR